MTSQKGTARGLLRSVLAGRYVPWNGATERFGAEQVDLRLDHRLVFDSAMVALRPLPSSRVEEIYAYETLSETYWSAGLGITASFGPDCFVRLGEHHLQRKLEAIQMCRSQLRKFPDERSVEALTALARLRGASVGTEAAEAFTTIRRLV